MNQETSNRKSLWMFIASMLIFGTIGIFRRYIPFSSAFLAFARGVSGGLFLLLFVRLGKKSNGEKLPMRTFLWLAVSGAVMGINWILLFEAYNYTTVGIATLCYYMQPVIVTLLSPLVFREKLSGVIGGTRAGSPRGILLGLGAAVFYSIVVIMNKKVPGLNAYRKTTVQLLSAELTMIPYMLLSGGTGSFSIGPAGILLLLAVCLIHTGLAYVLYFGSMDGLRAQSAAILSYIDPVTAFLLSALLLREPLSLPGIIGAVMIILSAVISET